MLTLTVTSGDSRGRTVRLQPDSAALLVGRGGECGLQLGDTHVSTRHGRIEFDGSSWCFRDLLSTNGSVLLRAGVQRRIDASCGSEVELQDGDRLLLGDPERAVVLAICEEEGEEEPRDVLALRRVSELPSLTVQVGREPARLAALYRLAQQVGRGLDLGEVLEQAARTIQELLPQTTHLAVFLREGERFVRALGRVMDPAGGGSAPALVDLGCEPDLGPLPGEEGAELHLSRTLLRQVLSEKAAVLASNAAEQFSGSHSIACARIRSTLCVPLWSEEEIIGLLQVDNRRVVGSFGERDLEALTVLAAQLSLAVGNARLFTRLRLAEEAARKEAGFLRAQERQQRRMILGESPTMRRVMELVARVRDTKVPVCVLGETGTGKELIARAIHDEGERRERLFVAQNMAALPDSLLESELFGHKKGAFTGADRDKKGLFETADGGTIFLDEIGELSPALQAKLLRVLQEGEIRPVGATASKPVDVRVISATHRDLEAEVEAGRFRQDLYYRLLVFPIKLPPLRERREDLPLLVRHFLERYSVELKRPPVSISPDALQQLTGYSWPGNIRELENEVQRLVIYGAEGGLVLPEHLSTRISQTASTLERLDPRPGTLKEMVAEVERVLVSRALRDAGGNKSQAARVLGLTREGLHKKLNKLGVV